LSSDKFGNGHDNLNGLGRLDDPVGSSWLGNPNGLGWVSPTIQTSLISLTTHTGQ